MNREPRRATCADLPALLFAGSLQRDSCAAIMWLHGIGERGNEPILVAKYGLPAALAAGRASASCDVICPQLPPNEEWEPDRVLSLVRYARATYSKVILIGFSLAGLGALNLVAQHGAACDLAIAIAAECRHWPTADQSGVRLVAVQGEHDYRPEVSNFVELVCQSGGTAEEVVVKGGDHFISESALWQPELQVALSAQSVLLRQHEA